MNISFFLSPRILHDISRLLRQFESPQQRPTLSRFSHSSGSVGTVSRQPEAVLRTLEQGSVPTMHQISELRALRDDLRLPLAKDEVVQALLAYAACKAPKP